MAHPTHNSNRSRPKLLGCRHLNVDQDDGDEGAEPTHENHASAVSWQRELPMMDRHIRRQVARRTYKNVVDASFVPECRLAALVRHRGARGGGSCFHSVGLVCLAFSVNRLHGFFSRRAVHRT